MQFSISRTFGVWNRNPNIGFVKEFIEIGEDAKIVGTKRFAFSAVSPSTHALAFNKLSARDVTGDDSAVYIYLSKMSVSWHCLILSY